MSPNGVGAGAGCGILYARRSFICWLCDDVNQEGYKTEDNVKHGRGPPPGWFIAAHGRDRWILNGARSLATGMVFAIAFHYGFNASEGGIYSHNHTDNKHTNWPPVKDALQILTELGFPPDVAAGIEREFNGDAAVEKKKKKTLKRPKKLAVRHQIAAPALANNLCPALQPATGLAAEAMAAFTAGATGVLALTVYSKEKIDTSAPNPRRRDRACPQRKPCRQARARRL